MATFGIEKAYVAKQTQDDASGLMYTVPQYYKHVQELSSKPKVNDDQAYAENRQIDQATMFANSDIAIKRYYMSAQEQAFLLGSDLSGDGGVISSAGDEAPYIAVLYKAPLRGAGNNAYRYGVFYKIMFTPPDSDMKGLEGKPDLSQVPELSGSAQSTEWSYKVGNKEKHPWEYHIDTTENLDDSFFNVVPVPTLAASTELALSSSNPANNATDVAATIHPVLTFNNVLLEYNTVLVNMTDGSIVNCTASLDDSKKVVTIVPGASLVAGKVYNLILANIMDLYGNRLPVQSIKFTVATA